MIKRLYIQAILLLSFSLSVNSISYAEEKAPSFDLPQWGSENRVSLDDLQGQIIVLDFFSASCGECFRASWEIGIEIKDFYNSHSGNPSGIAVNVLSINSDIANQEDMKAFIEDTEPDQVLDDSNGDLLKQYGGTTMPYIVVIDASNKGPNSSPHIVYRQSVYDGADKLRKVIDSITGKTEAGTDSPTDRSTDCSGSHTG